MLSCNSVRTCVISRYFSDEATLSWHLCLCRGVARPGPRLPQEPAPRRVLARLEGRGSPPRPLCKDPNPVMRAPPLPTDLFPKPPAPQPHAGDELSPRDSAGATDVQAAALMFTSSWFARLGAGCVYWRLIFTVGTSDEYCDYHCYTGWKKLVTTGN